MAFYIKPARYELSAINIRNCSQYDCYFCKGRIVLQLKDCTSKYSYLCVCRTLSASTRSSAWFVSKVGLSAVSSYFITSHCMWDAGGCLCLTNFLSFYCSTLLSFFLSTYHKFMRERHKLTCFSANLASPLFWHFCDELAS